MTGQTGLQTALLAALLLGALTLAACSARSVAGGDFYVAPGGSDDEPGTFEKPYATLAAARKAVRARVAAGLRRDVTVLIRGGTYWLAEGLAFGPDDSGTAEHAVTYAAYPNERVRLVGGVRLTGWRAYRGSIRAAEIPKGIASTQLFENGARVDLARAPNRGYFAIDKPVAGKDRSAFVYRAGDLDPGSWDLDGAGVFIWPGHDWFSQTKPIVAVEPETRTVTLGNSAGYAMKPGNRYFVRNVLELLDRPGECCITPQCRTVCLWPTAEPIDRQEIVLSTAKSLLAVAGDPKAGKLVRNLHFRGLDLEIAEGNVVSVTGAEDCSIRACRIENAGACGVRITGHARRITLYGNLIRHHGQHGVSLAGLAPGQADVNGHHVIENNHIHHCGRLQGHGYGVRICQSGHNRVVHNHIHHMPRYAATIKGTRYQVLRKQVKGVTWENRHSFLHSRNNLIAYNRIHHVNLDSQDTGALESWGPGRGNVYDHNLIHDVGNRRFNLQMGVYLDDATDYFTVTNNIIYNVVGAGQSQPIYAKGIGNRITNNILIVSPTNRAAVSSLYMAEERADHHEYTRNIIGFEGAPVVIGRWGGGAADLHAAGTTLSWKVPVPADGEYQLWLRCAMKNKPYGRANMDDRTTVQIDGGPPVWLKGLPDTGGWGVQKWHRTAGLKLTRGERVLKWVNVKGGGVNMDAWALCSDADWKPAGTNLADCAKGKALVVVHAETHLPTGTSADGRVIYDFYNWSDDRVAACDYNVYFKPGGALSIKGGPANGSFEKWRKILGGKFDAHSVVADPLFVDAARRNYRLRPDSPARKLGFQDIDTRAIGLKDDFPRRFERD